MPPEDPVAVPGAAARSGVHNRLVHEKSPYLLQHAENPVDWYPWGEEAFSRAAQEDKPVFLSIGYATCHWCHVMAHESFEDTEVAALLNRDFVSIKVDREERPDIDRVYMAVCQQISGQGGWPLTIVMTPEKKPFFAATYLPRENRFSIVGLLTLLPRITTLWQERRTDLIRAADRVIDAIAQPDSSVCVTDPGVDLPDEGYASLVLQFDPVYGGFGNEPKFPAPHMLLFLFRYGSIKGNARAQIMAEKTLDAIRSGGIYDHIGGGAHRYSTDARWRVPHFEKMLYDQALLVMAYTEACQLTLNPEYRKTAEEIIGYVMRELRAPYGAFYSAEDADSPDGEGAFYVWTMQELENVLGCEDAALAALVFGATPTGNYQDPERGDGHNILCRSQPMAAIAASLSLTEPDLTARMESIRARLFAARQQRARPSLDDKILADWNGLFVAALAQAGRVFKEEKYRTAARTAMEFILAGMRSEDGGLLHRYRNGDAAIPGFADDYAFIIHALIELYDTTFDLQYLSAARSLNGYFIEHFWDTQDGGFFTVSDSAEALIIRRKEVYDGALPSCNSAAFMNLIRLSRLTGDITLEEKASVLSRCFAGTVSQSPSACTWFLCGLGQLVQPHEVVIVGDEGAEDTRALLTALRSQYLPSLTVMQFAPGVQASALAELAPFTRDLSMIDGKATAYVCSGHTCSMPVTDPKAFLAQIERLKKHE